LSFLVISDLLGGYQGWRMKVRIMVRIAQFLIYICDSQERNTDENLKGQSHEVDIYFESLKILFGTF
jgi:hypothetical protein